MSRQSSADLTAALGHQLRRLRIEADLTQVQLANRADVGVSTVYGLEQGSGTLISLVRVLRALDRTDWLGELAPEPAVSPIQQLREARGHAPRKRVRNAGGEAASGVQAS
jgi:transcriptional regulator with XRE-family HTH domain